MLRTFLLACVLTSPVVSMGQSNDTLKSQFADKIVTLKVACDDRVLRFDPAGRLQNPCPTGIWTLHSGFHVQAIRLSGDRLLLDGKRIGFGWQGQTRKNFNTGELLHIEVEFPEAATEAAAATALQKIFVNRNDDPGSYLPELWAGYFGNPTQTAPKPAPTAMEKPSHDPLPTSMTADPLKATLALRETPRIRQSSGVVAGRLEKNVAPVYPELAKQWGLQGKVALACVIGKDGRVQKLTVAKPAGLGLDEAAAAAVQKWKYKPYIFNGQAMEVDSVIVITFKLRGTNEPTTLGSN